MFMFSHQQSSNVRNEDAVVNHAFGDGSRLFAVFDGTSWRGVFPEGGFEVAQEVASVLPRLVWAEMARLPASQSQEKRARPSEGAQDTRVLRALQPPQSRQDAQRARLDAEGAARASQGAALEVAREQQGTRSFLACVSR